jgi:hypothetical protein
MKSWTWLCPILSIAVVIGILVTVGLSPWTAVVGGLVLGCPIVALWAYFTGRSPQIRPDAGNPVTRVPPEGGREDRR